MSLRFPAIRARFPAIPQAVQRGWDVNWLLVDAVLGFGLCLLVGLTAFGQTVVGAGLILASLALAVVHYADRLQLDRVREELRETKEQLAQLPK